MVEGNTTSHPELNGLKACLTTSHPGLDPGSPSAA
jgi:hypothetical protein